MPVKPQSIYVKTPWWYLIQLIVPPSKKNTPWNCAHATVNASCSRKLSSPSSALTMVTMATATKPVKPLVWVVCWPVQLPVCRLKHKNAAKLSSACSEIDGQNAKNSQKAGPWTCFFYVHFSS